MHNGLLMRSFAKVLQFYLVVVEHSLLLAGLALVVINSLRLKREALVITVRQPK